MSRASPRKRLQALASQASLAGGYGGEGRERARYPRSQGSISPRRVDVPLESMSTRSDGGYVMMNPGKTARSARRHPAPSNTPDPQLQRVRSRSTPYGATPPPYTESDTSIMDDQQRPSIDLTADDLAMIEGLATPRARSERLPSIGSRRLVDVASITSVAPTDPDTETEEQRMYHEETVREMERRAEEFYRTGLMGRCWDTWVQSFEWIKVCTSTPCVILRGLTCRARPTRSTPSGALYSSVKRYRNGRNTMSTFCSSQTPPTPIIAPRYKSRC